MENAKELNECLCCGSKNLSMTLDLGVQPMANSFLVNEDDEELTFPLVLNLCRDCFHLQLSHADRKSTRLNSSHIPLSRMPSSA